MTWIHKGVCPSLPNALREHLQIKKPENRNSKFQLNKVMALRLEIFESQVGLRAKNSVKSLKAAVPGVYCSFFSQCLAAELWFDLKTQLYF